MPDLMLDSTKKEAIQEDALRREITERWKVSANHYKDWEDEAKDDYKFALGDQWKNEDRETLKNQGRPCLTFNRIRPLINLVSGYQRENAARIKVNPEGGEDKVFSEVMDRGIKHIDKVSHFNYKLGYMFDDGLYCGKGWLEAIITYDNDAVRGDIDFKQLTPYQIKVDPECREYDINDGARYAFKCVRLTKEALTELYPKKKKLIDGFREDTDDWTTNGDGYLGDAEGVGADNDYNNAATRNYVKTPNSGQDSTLEKDFKFTVKEYWRYKMVTKYFVIDLASGDPKKFDSKEKAEGFILQQNFGNVIERKVKEMHVASFVCGWVLQDEISPFEPYYSGFPFFRFIADWAPNADNEILRVQGMTRPLKDPQMEKNKAKSQMLHIVNTTANSGWEGDEDALTEEGWKQLEEGGSKAGLIIKKKKGAELTRLTPGQIPTAHLAREEKADEEFKQISSINPDLMGFQEGTTSGKAISLRIKQAILALVRLFSNYRYTKEVIGKFLLLMMPMVFDAKKLTKILGTDYMMKAQITEGHVAAFLTMVADNRYDVFVTESDQNATIRYEIFDKLTQLVQSGLPIPPDLLIDYMDIPNSEEVKQRVLQMQQQQQMAQMQQTAMKAAPKPPQGGG